MNTFLQLFYVLTRAAHFYKCKMIVYISEVLCQWYVQLLVQKVQKETILFCKNIRIIMQKPAKVDGSQNGLEKNLKFFLKI